jgi:hypothetical protein
LAALGAATRLLVFCPKQNLLFYKYKYTELRPVLLAVQAV